MRQVESPGNQNSHVCPAAFYATDKRVSFIGRCLGQIRSIQYGVHPLKYAFCMSASISSGLQTPTLCIMKHTLTIKFGKRIKFG